MSMWMCRMESWRTIRSKRNTFLIKPLKPVRLNEICELLFYHSLTFLWNRRHHLGAKENKTNTLIVHGGRLVYIQWAGWQEWYNFTSVTSPSGFFFTVKCIRLNPQTKKTSWHNNRPFFREATVLNLIIYSKTSAYRFFSSVTLWLLAFPVLKFKIKGCCGTIST